MKLDSFSEESPCHSLLTKVNYQAWKLNGRVGQLKMMFVTVVADGGIFQVAVLQMPTSIFQK